MDFSKNQTKVVQLITQNVFLIKNKSKKSTVVYFNPIYFKERNILLALYVSKYRKAKS